MTWHSQATKEGIREITILPSSWVPVEGDRFVWVSHNPGHPPYFEEDVQPDQATDRGGILSVGISSTHEFCRTTDTHVELLRPVASQPRACFRQSIQPVKVVCSAAHSAEFPPFDCDMFYNKIKNENKI